MNKSHGLNLHLGSLWLNLGWYPGDPFKFFDFTLGEIERDLKTNDMDYIVVFSLQMAYFTLAAGWHKV